MKTNKEMLDSNILKCPVCGNMVEEYDICDNCGWENTGSTNIDGGPNEMTLKEAIKAYELGIAIK